MEPADTAGWGCRQDSSLYWAAVPLDAVVDVPGLCPPPEPYSHAVRAGDTLYLAGQVALDAACEVVGTTVAEQARQVWDNIVNVLAASGSSIADVVPGDPVEATAARMRALGLDHEVFDPAATQADLAGRIEQSASLDGLLSSGHGSRQQARPLLA